MRILVVELNGESGEPEDQTAVHRGDIGATLQADDVAPPVATEMLPPLDD